MTHPGRGRHLAWLAAGLMLWAGGVGAPAASEVPPSGTAASAGTLDVDITGGKVSVRARDVTLRELLEELARRGGFALELHGSFDERATVRLDGVALPEALQRIVRPHGFVLRLAPPSTLWVFSGNARLAERAVENERHPEAPRAAVIPEQLGLDLVDADPEARVEAASKLAEIGGGQAAALLVEAALYDDDPRVREEAVFGLSDLGDETAAVPVFERAIRDPDPTVRQAALEAVAVMGGENAIRVLRYALADDRGSIREAAADVLDELSGRAP